MNTLDINLWGDWDSRAADTRAARPEERGGGMKDKLDDMERRMGIGRDERVRGGRW